MDAFTSLVDAGWNADVAARPHGQHTTVIIHLDAENRQAALHLGPVLTDSRRLRRALEHRDRCCAVPGCGATRGLHAHHIVHWEDGGPTDLDNLVLLCPFHHRLHHFGGITITGPASNPAADHWANAPNGGGTPPSNPNHHQAIESLMRARGSTVRARSRTPSA